MINNETRPYFLYANGFWNTFTGKKKYDITCGKCRFNYTDKVLFATGDTATSICPNCKSVNKWSHSKFQEFYDRQLEL